MQLKKALQQDFDSVKAAYMDIAHNTPDMDMHARYDYGKHPKEEDIKAYIDAGNMYLFMDGQTIAGVVAITMFQGKDYHPVKWQTVAADDEVMVLHLLGIVPAYQRRGTGSAMIRQALQMGQENSMKACRLDTLESNIPAQKLYEKLGFTYCGTQHWYADNTGWTNFYLYEYVLNGAAL